MTGAARADTDVPRRHGRHVVITVNQPVPITAAAAAARLPGGIAGAVRCQDVTEGGAGDDLEVTVDDQEVFAAGVDADVPADYLERNVEVVIALEIQIPTGLADAPVGATGQENLAAGLHAAARGDQ